MNNTLHVLCVLNPTAGNGICRERWPEVASLMGAFNLSYEVLTLDDRPLAEAFQEYFQHKSICDYHAICGIGGDGTHSQIINGLMRLRARNPGCRLPPYAMIPLGTGNDIAKSFGLTAKENLFASDLRRAVATIRHGADYFLDIGRMGDLYFVDALTIGLDSRVLEDHNRRKAEMAQYPFLNRIIRGNLLYTCCLGLRVWRHDAIKAVINIDGLEWYNGSVVNLVVNNTRIYGGEFVICPASVANDGLFEVVVFAGHYDYLAKYMLSLRGNPREIRKMAEKVGSVSSYTQGQKISVSLSRREAAQYDGEILLPGDSFEVEVVPRAIHLKVPAEPI